ncbi:hypothetical protein ND38_004816 [Escherichia coli]|uniref:hypothetical protein n=1 Tax=Escherichia coli TaxID=562 RepID=UPI0016AE63CB|nr:hypothetical protein [Escherichia coli]EFZ2275685.1 hypothetical protein [Shigella sonnei]MDC5273930.1 hypothetical protein [Acinetobacter baumannii]EFC7717720.1 hypothetical protein [Escherichia coli]EFC9933800.1 hypothetical protein [Escherichia coli]EFJ5561981.1 hypothetical protein [Escherichia coli]
MTVHDRSIPEDVYQSFCRLRDSVDGFSAVAKLIPDGEDDFCSFGHLLRMVSDSLHGCLDVHWRSIADAEFVKR